MEGRARGGGPPPRPLLLGAAWGGQLSLSLCWAPQERRDVRRESRPPFRPDLCAPGSDGGRNLAPRSGAGPSTLASPRKKGADGTNARPNPNAERPCRRHLPDDSEFCGSSLNWLVHESWGSAWAVLVNCAHWFSTCPGITTGTLLVLRWCRIDMVQHWYCAGRAPVLHWYGTGLVLHW